MLRQLGLNKSCAEALEYLLLVSIADLSHFKHPQWILYRGAQGTLVRFYDLALLVFLVIGFDYLLVTYVGFTRILKSKDSWLSIFFNQFSFQNRRFLLVNLLITRFF